jgi:hypothetical protein
MASPYREGTSSSLFSSRDLDILREKISITINKDLLTAHYLIEYFVKTDKNRGPIPLLFHAKGYKGDFKVWLDGQMIKLSDIPSDYHINNKLLSEKFVNLFKEPPVKSESDTIVSYWEDNSGAYYELNDLKYFEAIFTKGEHKIQVEYTAYAWLYLGNWVKEYSLHYSLFPARYWKSFGLLEIKLDTSALNCSFTSNIGQPSIRIQDNIACWNFSDLPTDDLVISYTPKINVFAKLMIAIGPFGLSIIIGLLIAFLHVLSIKRFRKKNPTEKYSLVVIVGSLANPLFILIGYMVSYALIDLAIGSEAGGRHGYTFLVLLLYPILLPIYWVIMWLIDWIIKKKINKVP